MRAVLSMLFCLTFLGGSAIAYEEPRYEVVEEYDGLEIRRYEPYLVAETVVEADFSAAGNLAFRRLFGYISGKNRQQEKIPMTAPVISEDRGTEIEMTVPVVSAPDGVGSYRYQFVLPDRFTTETAPVPEDPRVLIREIPARTVAALRFSGFWSESNYRNAEEDLLGALAGRPDLDVDGAPVFARYNGPMTPWFLRRNEVLVEVQGR